MVLGRLFTRCPLDDPREKAWTEMRMQWLSEQFGLEPLLNADVLLPTSEHFPEPYHGMPEDAERLLQRMRRQLHVDPTAKIVLQIHADVEMPHAAGTFEEDESGGTIIRATESQLTDPLQLIATLSHELAHQRLLGEKRLAGTEDDHERLTDLLPVFFGAGVFAANAVIQETSRTEGNWYSWSISQWGYLPARIFGYAFALFAWIRDEQRPSWADHLRTDARTALLQGLKYLRKTGDSIFRRDTAGTKTDPPTVDDLVADLKEGTPGRRIHALWQLQDRDDAPPALPAVVHALHDRSSAVLATALDTLAGIGAPDEEADRAVSLLLQHAHPEVRGKAAFALSRVATHPEDAVQQIAASLVDSSAPVVRWAASALATYGPAAAEMNGYLLTPLKRALVRGDLSTVDHCLVALEAVAPDADRLLSETFTDPELYREASELLQELREAHARDSGVSDVG